MDTGRNKTYDGLKFLLIVLVTIGHFSEPYRYTHSMIGAGYSVIYLFHMPLFILLSGYFSKHITLKKNKEDIFFCMGSLFGNGFDMHRVKKLYLVSSYYTLFFLLVYNSIDNMEDSVLHTAKTHS